MIRLFIFALAAGLTGCLPSKDFKAALGDKSDILSPILPLGGPQRFKIKVVEGQYSLKHTEPIPATGPVRVVFQDDHDRELMRAELNPGDRLDGKRRLRRSVRVLISKNLSSAVISTKDIDLDERNPYTVRASSAHFTWYTASGSIVCDMHAPMQPAAVSSNGTVILTIDTGLDPVEFERLNDVQGIKSLADLENDRKLTASHLFLLNSSCEVFFTTTSAFGGWGTNLISPSGKWVALRLYSEHKLLRIFSTINRVSFSLLLTPGINLLSISDNGTLTAQKFLGPNPENPNVGKFQPLVWRPGMESLEPGGEPEEERDPR